MERFRIPRPDPTPKQIAEWRATGRIRVSALKANYGWGGWTLYKYKAQCDGLRWILERYLRFIKYTCYEETRAYHKFMRATALKVRDRAPDYQGPWEGDSCVGTPFGLSYQAFDDSWTAWAWVNGKYGQIPPDDYVAACPPRKNQMATRSPALAYLRWKEERIAREFKESARGARFAALKEKQVRDSWLRKRAHQEARKIVVDTL